MANKYAFVEFPISQPEFVDSSLGKLRVDALVDALNRDLPRGVQFLNVIQTTLQKRYSSENVTVKLFNYQLEDEDVDKVVKQNQDLHSNDPSMPLFLVLSIISKYGRTINLVYSPDDPTPEMLLEFSKLFDWSNSEGLIFGTVNARFVPFLDQVGKSLGGKVESNPNWTMYIPRAKWTSVTRPSPSGVKVQKLSKKHASIVNSHWKFATEGQSLKLFQDAIQYFISAGVFLNNPSNDPDDDSGHTDSSQELGSWIASMPIGTLNALHTPEKHRRKGFAELTMREASRQAVELGVFPLCEVELESLASKALLEKIGFEVAFDASWVFYSPGNV